MMAQIIFWATIVTFIVYPARLLSVPQKNENSICSQFVSRRYSRRVFHQISYRETDYIYDSIKYRWVYKTEYYTQWKPQLICCPGYEYRSGTCQPLCWPQCKNGHCTRPNTCICNYGWGGDSCSEPISCFIAQPCHINCSETVRDAEFKQVQQTKKTIKNPQIEEDGLSKCRPECNGEINSTSVNRTRSGNMTYYFIPLHASCNTDYLSFWKKYRYEIGAAIEITLFLLIICIVCIVRKKRKPRSTDTELDRLRGSDVTRKSPNPEIDQLPNTLPIQCRTFEHMVDNTIYAQSDTV